MIDDNKSVLVLLVILAEAVVLYIVYTWGKSRGKKHMKKKLQKRQRIAG